MGAPMTAAPLVHFQEEQRRHRRSSAVSAALVVVVLAVSGIPLSIVISPFLIAAAAIPAYLVDLAFDVPHAVTGWLDRAFNLLPTMWSAVQRRDVDLPWDWLTALFVYPGLVVMLLLGLTLGLVGWIDPRYRNHAAEPNVQLRWYFNWRDVLGRMGFRPRVAENLHEMDRRLYARGPMGLAADFGRAK